MWTTRRDIVGGETDLMGRPLRLYDHVKTSMPYGAGKQSWKGSTPTCVCLLGRLDPNHVASSMGRDLRLVPPQNDEPILFFAGPHAEVNGECYPGIRRSITFSGLEGEVGGG